MATAHSQIVAIVSDVHWPHHDAGAWAAFRAWHRDVRPYWTILLGDLLDLASISRHDKTGDEPLAVLGEIKQAVREVNALVREAKRVTFAEGNHEARWQRIFAAVPPHTLEGLTGLTLREQMKNHGLDESVEWFKESIEKPGISIAQFVLRHGHQQAGRFGGGINVASNRLNKSLGTSELLGHHHAAQHVARAAHGKTTQVVANPCLSSMHAYAGSDMVWPLGFTVLEVLPGWQWATPHLIVMSPQRSFAFGGKVYGGRA